ncbi:MAG: phosphoribosylglycinamide formyltransferase [Calditrichaeota bacterium]|nr:MAG: phosphoribosylglycinamide formyltransferase [Calditrichota bacterium]MBL1206570.1 phosphoribosylglycinamide formyltransferase [Calditrichota bacterium]NOG46397.1 phosphoribosylglycinamide formyltransferase [Calditrichota bacterium]
MKNVAVFASGRGSNFEQLCIAQNNGKLPAKIGLLIASKNGIGAIETAKKYRIAHAVFDTKEFDDLEKYNHELLARLDNNNINFIALAGWLRLIHSSVIEKFQNRIINIHPALLPFFGGKGMYGAHVHRAVFKSGMLVSGATVHLVDPEFDHGHIILQESVQLSCEDTPESIAEKVLKIEHRIFPKALSLLVEGNVILKNNRVFIKG